MAKIFTKEELLQFNEKMLGRGMPVNDDGVGYNKADYSACANYFNGCSNAQLADLSKRLVKYCNTQLELDKNDMEATSDYFSKMAGDYSREDGISLNITENGTLFSFRYNEVFVEAIKSQPKRRWDADNKNWVLPNDKVIPALNKLKTIGADVDNALEYAMQNPLINKCQSESELEIKIIIDEDYALLKFDYNKDILDLVKKIPQRQWNKEYKYWKINKSYFEGFKKEVSAFAKLKFI